VHIPDVGHVGREIRVIEIGLNVNVRAVNVRAKDELIRRDVERITACGLQITSPPVARLAAARGIVLYALYEYKKVRVRVEHRAGGLLGGELPVG